MSNMKNLHYTTTEGRVKMLDDAIQLRLDAHAVDHGRDAQEYVELDIYSAEQIAEWATDDHALAESFSFNPLSAEWSGESIPEIFGYTPDDDTLQRWEDMASEQFYMWLKNRVNIRHMHNATTAISAYGGNQLAHRADCASPDNPESAGTQYLTAVRDNILEAYRYNIEHGNTFDRYDDCHEQVDAAVPIYTTHGLWSAFVDLAAYNADVEDMRPSHEDYPAVALYTIGMTLADELCNEIGLA